MSVQYILEEVTILENGKNILSAQPKHTTLESCVHVDQFALLYTMLHLFHRDTLRPSG
jgi:hypothetical protein